MKLRVLGSSGGIGGRGQRTTALLVDDDVLIDAGTGVGDLEFEDLLRIDHVFVTHAHLDHIAMIPLLVDTVGEARSMPIVVHGSAETLRILRSHIFNWLVWPDFSSIPDRGNPFLRFQEMRTGESTHIGGGRQIVALPALHTVPAVAYHLQGEGGSLVFSGDTAYSEPLIAAINGIPDLRHHIDTGYDEIGRILDELARLGLVQRSAEGLWALLYRPESVSLLRLWHHFVLDLNASPADDAISHSLTELVRPLEAGLDISLAEFLRRYPPAGPTVKLPAVPRPG